MAVAVICEFNPFHNGHKYFLEQVKKLTGEEIIAVMSGSFTQRGEVAVTDKFFRAKTALENGADLVVELPAAYSVASAQRFAQAGASIAKSFDSVNYLAFGCETADAELLMQAARAVESAETDRLVSKKMGEGEYYPRALESAVREIFGEETASVLSSPNNILAVEYIKALIGSKIKSLPILRKGVAHDSEETSGTIASASHIRKLLREGADISPFVPFVPVKITREENLERAMLYCLRAMSREELALLPEVSEGLENRIYDAVKKYNSVEEILSAVKTKRYTHARLRRIICCAFLQITAEEQTLPIEYVRVLGFSEKGAGLLKGCSLKVVTSVAKALDGALSDNRVLLSEIRATDSAAIAYDIVESCSSDFVIPVIKTNKQ